MMDNSGVTVESERMKPVTHALALGRKFAGFPPKAAVTGFFVFQGDRQGALADGLHGLNPINTGIRTPRNAPNELGQGIVKTHGISGGKLGHVDK